MVSYMSIPLLSVALKGSYSTTTEGGATWCALSGYPGRVPPAFQIFLKFFRFTVSFKFGFSKFLRSSIFESTVNFGAESSFPFRFPELLYFSISRVPLDSDFEGSFFPIFKCPLNSSFQSPFNFRRPIFLLIPILKCPLHFEFTPFFLNSILAFP